MPPGVTGFAASACTSLCPFQVLRLSTNAVVLYYSSTKTDQQFTFSFKEFWFGVLFIQFYPRDLISFLKDFGFGSSYSFTLVIILHFLPLLSCYSCFLEWLSGGWALDTLMISSPNQLVLCCWEHHTFWHLMDGNFLLRLSPGNLPVLHQTYIPVPTEI